MEIVLIMYDNNVVIYEHVYDQMIAYMITYGYIWPYIIICDNIWSNAVMYDYRPITGTLADKLQPASGQFSG